MALLDVSSSPLEITTFPSQKPPSGTLLLYNRNITRRYKSDGHKWIKKKNSNKVREDHVKLRVNKVPVVSGMYVHCEDNPNFHRRTYTLLKKNVNPAFSSSSKTQQQKGQPDSDFVRSQIHENVVLVHYLDTDEASRVAQILAQKDRTNRTSINVNVALNNNLIVPQKTSERNTVTRVDNAIQLQQTQQAMLPFQFTNAQLSSSPFPTMRFQSELQSQICPSLQSSLSSSSSQLSNIDLYLQNLMALHRSFYQANQK